MKLVFFLLSIIFLFSPQSAFAQEEILEATVVEILEEKEILPEYSDQKQLYQKIELLITKGSIKDKKIIVENGNVPIVNNLKYQAGDRVTVAFSRDLEGNDIFYITDYIRRDSLAWLLVIFIIVVVAIGRWQGIASMLGMGVSFLVIFKFILPRILAGAEPVWTVVLGSLVIVPITFLLSHGASKKTAIAIVGTLISLVITGVLANAFVQAVKLTGFSSEEAGFLQAYLPGQIDIKGLLLAGIIIGVLGTLDDITIAQSAIVQQLKEVNPKLRPGHLYDQAMKVGKDHIASMVNTLILVYAGASLPLLLLFINNPHPFSEVVNYEIIASEVVRTLVGSISLVLAVPVTTLLASMLQ